MRQEDFNKEIEKEGEFKIAGHKIILKRVRKNQVKLNDDKNIEFLDYDLVPSRLKFRSWKEGDAFVPLGMKGSMKISDFLINNKISIIDKKKILVLSSRSEIIWVCGMRLSDRFKITENTTKYLKVEYKQK